VPEVEVIGDISAALDDLTAALEQTDASYDRAWYRPIRRRILDDIASYNLNEGEAFTIPGVLNVIRDSLDDDGLLISDVGSHKMWIARNFPTYRPNGCIITNGLASMGMALPGGIAASLVDRQRQVVAVMGDGGFLMNSQELETAVRLGVGFTIVIVSDNDYGLIKWKQDMSRGKSFGTEIGNPDFKAYAESFGIKAYHPQSLHALKEQMAEAVQSPDLSVVVAQVDPRVNNELVSKLNTYWENHS
jgi:acetolactate synthase-1/2/3 large subunit